MRPRKRKQLFEIHDLPWCPAFIRDAITDTLHQATISHDFYGPVVPLLKRMLEKLDCREIYDLCSGGSGPLPLISERLDRELGYPVRITLTDLYPNVEAFRKAARESGGRISFLEQPVNAADVPDGLRGFRTLFSSFHHFGLELAESILRDAAEKREGIGIFEINGRGFPAFVFMLGAPWAVLTTMPSLKPLTWKKLLFTYVIPVIPAIAAWDSHVSNLRAYSTDELQEITARLEIPGYTWEYGRIPGNEFQRVTYLLGYPVQQGTDE